MKSIFALSALICTALATSVNGVPTPSEPLFVSRMVRRQVQHDNSAPVALTAASTCGDYALQEPQKLQVRSYNDSTTAFISVTLSKRDQTPVLTVIDPNNGQQGAYEFDFQTCNFTGFTQGYSRNSGGSMGAPLEYWGRVVTNLTTSAAEKASTQQCLAASSTTSDNKAGTFTFDTCNDADSKQWFRLQEGLGGAVLTYFPVKNTTDYVYDGQIPAYFKADLHAEASRFNAVEYDSANSQQYVQFY